ncbi:MAG: ferrochelatase [Polyangiaceae bacterium]
MSRAVLLVSHGSVDDLADLEAFVTRVRRGRPPPPEMVAELRRRYEAIGGSPLNAINARLAAHLGARMGVRVALASRLCKPFVRDVLATLAGEGVTGVAVVALAPYSGHVYAADARSAAEGVGLEVVCAASWGRHPLLTGAFAARILAALHRCSEAPTTLVMTAHSLPRSVIDAGDPYEREVRQAYGDLIALVQARGDERVRTVLAFQSQGMAGPGERPVEWLGPDLAAAADDAKVHASRHVLFAPIGFLADHVEVLYDLDIEARTMVESRGMTYHRAASLNADDDLVGVLAAVAQPLLDRG